MKCAKADAPVKDAVAKEDWDLAATCSSEGVNLRAALGKATPHKDQAPPRLATLNPNDDVPLPPAPTKNLHNDLSAMLAYEELLDSTAAAVRAAEAASKRAAMQDLPVACLMRVKDEVLKKYQVSGGGRNLFLAGLKAGLRNLAPKEAETFFSFFLFFGLPFIFPDESRRCSKIS